MGPHHATARVHKGGVVTVSGVPVPEGEEVEVIVLRKQQDAARYANAPVTNEEFSDNDDPLGWDADGWDDHG